MNESGIITYNGRPARSTEMEIGDTLFTVIHVQSEKAGESAFDKVKRLILGHSAD